MSKPPINNPPFEVIECNMRNFKEETGDDMAYWHIDVRTAEYKAHVMLLFDLLWRYCTHAHPDAADYLSSVRNSIPGLGPRHGEMMDVIGEEGYDLMPLITAYIREHVDLDAHHQHDLKVKEWAKDPENHKAAAEKAESLGSLFPAMKDARLRYERLTDELLAFLNAKVLDIYPEILESDPQNIRELKHVVYDVTRTAGDSISSFWHKAMDGRA